MVTVRSDKLNVPFVRSYDFTIPRLWGGSGPLRAFQHPCGQQKHRFQKAKHGLDGESDQPEGQEQEPHDRVEDQGEKSQGPAEKQQNQP